MRKLSIKLENGVHMVRVEVWDEDSNGMVMKLAATVQDGEFKPVLFGATLTDAEVQEVKRRTCAR